MQVNQQIRDFGIRLLISLAVLIAIFLAIRFYLNIEVKQTREELARETGLLNSLETSAFRKEVERFNAELANFEILEKKQGKLSGILTEIAQKMPADLTLDRLTVDQSTGRIEIAGRASNRNSVLSFRQALIASERFKNINFPLANLEKPSNVAWQYRFFLK